MRGNAPQVVEALWAAKEEPPAKLVGFSLAEIDSLCPLRSPAAGTGHGIYALLPIGEESRCLVENDISFTTMNYA